MDPLNSPTRDTTIFRSGVASWKCPTTATVQPTSVAGNTLYGVSQTSFVRGYMLFDAAPASVATVMACASNSASVPSSGVSAKLTSAGKLQLFNEVTDAQIGSDSADTLSMNGTTWYRIEMKVIISAGNQVTDAELRLDGVTVASTTGATITASTQCFFGLLAGGTGVNAYVDDVAFNDSTGTANNTWPGSGKVVLLLPISDNAVGTGWTGGAGGTTNLWDAVNNTPPVGVADTGTDTSQIRNATANASVNYDANLTTYTTAGIGASDTINALTPWTATAAPVVTSAKQGTFGVSSNPVIANIALAAGGTAGAFWSGSAGGTFPTGWKWSPGTITEAPSVTLGNSPVIRITQVTSSTRIAMVCFMGMYVDYTPAAVTAVPWHPYPTVPFMPNARN